MKIHKTFSLELGIAKLLSEESNASLLIEGLLRNYYFPLEEIKKSEDKDVLTEVGLK